MYFSAGAHFSLHQLKMHGIAKSNELTSATQMEFGSFDGGEDGAYSGVGFVKISNKFAVQSRFFSGTEQFGRL